MTVVNWQNERLDVLDQMAVWFGFSKIAIHRPSAAK